VFSFFVFVVWLCGLCKEFVGYLLVVVVDDVDFDIVDGEFFLMFGLFGLGKIMVLCIIVGFEEFMVGMVELVGVDMMCVLVYDCDVNIVF